MISVDGGIRQVLDDPGAVVEPTKGRNRAAQGASTLNHTIVAFQI